MFNLTTYLTGQLEDEAKNCRESLAAATPRIAQAEALAEKIQSQGIPAFANGRAQGPHILVWVSAGPVTPDRMDAALTRIDLVEVSRFPGATEYEIRLHGIDVPLYVRTPLTATAN